MKSKQLITFSLLLLAGLVLWRSNAISHLTRMFHWQVGMIQSQNDWRTPIKFYGKVVDEHNAPVENAQIHFGCNDLSLNGTSFYQAVSDKNGLFSLTKIRGKQLVDAGGEKWLLHLSARQQQLHLRRRERELRSRCQKPYFFHLRKKGIAETLIVTEFPGFAKIAQLRRGAPAVEVDLLRGVNVPGNGKLRLEFRGGAC